MCVSGTRVIAAVAALLAVMSANAPAAIAGPDCTCRFQGQSFAVDSCVCIDRGDGPKLACCEIVLNNTSWSFSAEACPTASADEPGAVQAASAPFTPIPAALQGRR